MNTTSASAFGLAVNQSTLLFGAALRQVVFLVARNAGYIESLGHGNARLAVGVNHVVGGALVGFLEDGEVNDVFAHKCFVGHLRHDHLAVLAEDDDVVQCGAVKGKLVLFQAGADKAFLAVARTASYWQWRPS